MPYKYFGIWEFDRGEKHIKGDCFSIAYLFSPISSIILTVTMTTIFKDEQVSMHWNISDI